MTVNNHTGKCRGFTLIELLVVIAIIAVLISILLPALRSARESARTARCAVNFRSVGQGFTMYANDYKDGIWEAGYTNGALYRFWYGQPKNPLAAAGASNPVILGPAFEYLNLVDRVFECPSARRQAVTTFTSNPNDPYWNTPQGSLQRVLWEQFLGERNLNFDYTMATGVSGAKLFGSIAASWDTRCRTRVATAPRPNLIPAGQGASLVRLPGVPVFCEEDTEWHNRRSPDGLWSNWDQITRRHEGQGHFVTVAGDLITFKPPKGTSPDTQNDIGDFVANDLYVSKNSREWYILAPSWPGTQRPFGWVNAPR